MLRSSGWMRLKLKPGSPTKRLAGKPVMPSTASETKTGANGGSMLREWITIGSDFIIAFCRASGWRQGLFGLHPGVLVEQPLLVGRLALHLLGLQVEVGEHRDLGLQDEGVHRLE